MYNRKVHMLSPERKKEYDEHQALRYTKTYGKEVGEAMRCDQKYKGANKWKEEEIWDKFIFEDLGGAMWLDQARYVKYVDGQRDKPWLLMFVKTPYSIDDNHFQTHEVIMSRVYCVCQALGINMGVIDLHKEEYIKESFNYNEGDYGFAVPYYIYV